MLGNEVYDILRKIGATHLHHANSVTTSCTFLEQGALLSRSFVEDRGLQQTAQVASDAKDKEYGIWNRVFVDHVDIHDRGGRKKGPNQYGPVLFAVDLDVLKGLPAGSDVLVTRVNPVHWYDKQPDGERWFQSAKELEGKIFFGDFNKMLVIHIPPGKLDFPSHRARVVLDDPKKQVSTGQDAYTFAEGRIRAAAVHGRIEVSIERRTCHEGCICLEKYAKYTPQNMDFYFA